MAVPDCPAGGVGVDAWVGDGSFSSPSLSWVTLSENGGDDCERGGGLLVTSTSPTTTTKAVTVEGHTSTKGDYGAPQNAAGVGARDAQAADRVIRLSGCVVRNNSALLGGGIAVSPGLSPSFSGLSSSSLMLPAGVAFPTEPREKSQKFLLRETTTIVRRGGNEQLTSSSVDSETATPMDDVGFQRSGSTSPVVSDQSQEARTLLAASTGARSNGKAAALLGFVIDGGTVIEENRAASGGGIWASGAAVTVTDGGGEVSIRGNIAEGLREGCVEEVREKKRPKHACHELAAPAFVFVPESVPWMNFQHNRTRRGDLGRTHDLTPGFRYREPVATVFHVSQPIPVASLFDAASLVNRALLSSALSYGHLLSVAGHLTRARRSLTVRRPSFSAIRRK